ncbi:hypothetical protein BO71DRAFT_428718 [Aspergillus ellipticus CBS 707.79]|uniref:Uncharacterized protein n=1 Tax=Aspergillus ellipticus CBS 707.79 TaxID=1448320 RepID=A0A319EW64_9EURO|nr:hypothetical protein BO71DRAFT_428718 [Aspergillus ellipticus CBS 707.79]
MAGAFTVCQVSHYGTNPDSLDVLVNLHDTVPDEIHAKLSECLSRADGAMYWQIYLETELDLHSFASMRSPDNEDQRRRRHEETILKHVINLYAEHTAFDLYASLYRSQKLGYGPYKETARDLNVSLDQTGIPPLWEARGYQLALPSFDSHVAAWCDIAMESVGGGLEVACNFTLCANNPEFMRQMGPTANELCCILCSDSAIMVGSRRPSKHTEG